MIVTLASVAWVTIGAQLASRLSNAAELRRRAETTGRLRAKARMPILMPVSGRPAYLRRVLESLSRVEGIGETVLVFSQDGRNPEVSALIEGVDFADKIILRHTRPFLGLVGYFRDHSCSVSSNIHFLMEYAFKELGAESAILLEDDLVVSPDFYRYFVWAERHLLKDPTVMTVTGFNLNSRAWDERGFDPREHPLEMIENKDRGRPVFTCWSWVIRKASWERVRKLWYVANWDIGLTAIQRKLGLKTYKPLLGRTKTIGMQGGINFTERDDSPKWQNLRLSEGGVDFSQPPVLVDTELIPPIDPGVEKGELSPSEARRHRPRMVMLLLSLAVLAVAEWYFLWRL